MAKKNYYAVVKGRKPGIYRTWYGEDGAEAQVKNFAGAVFKGFVTLREAKQWIEQQNQRLALVKEHHQRLTLVKEPRPPQTEKVGSPSPPPLDSEDTVIIYTDGACAGNPGRGGYAAVILDHGQRKEISGGYIHTTNNRMELTACIAALQLLSSPCRVLLYSDSSYVVNGITRGWAKKWRSRGWHKANGDPAENPDLWEKLLELTEKHMVEFRWLRGHGGNAENERCDRLAVQASQQPKLPPDLGYIANHQKTSSR